MKIGVLAAIPAVLALAWPAWAQSGETTNFSGQRFFPSKTREGVLDTEWGGIPEAGAIDLGLWLNYARNPLVIYTDEMGSLDRSGALVRDRFDGNLLLDVALLEWFEIGFDLGLVFYQGRGDQIDVGGQPVPLPSISSAGVGDMRILPKIRLLNAEDFGVDLSLIGQISFPIANSSNYLGDTGFTGSPGIAISRAFDQGFRILANLGVKLRDPASSLGLEVDHQFFYRVGYAYRFDGKGNDLPLELAVGISGETNLQNFFQSSVESPLEILGSVAYDVLPSTQILAGGGVGVGRGYGAPDARAILALRWSHRTRDRDGDGVADGDDECIDDPEDVDGFEDANGCPDPDNDQDGHLDAKDKCPDDAEDKDGFEDEDGCPDPDNDKDGTLDAKDKCPLEPGPAEYEGCPDTDGDGIAVPADQCPTEPEDKDDFKDEDGCPDTDNDQDGVVDASDKCPLKKGPVENRGCPDADRDGDTVVDRLDNCPDEPGPPSNNGCKRKQLVQISAERLTILDRVYFKTGSSVLRRRSYRLLENIAAVLLAHPEIDRVTIEGHTDSRGSERLNKRLSQGRAESVRKYLIEKGGVDGSRLEAIGYGEEQPIESNKTRSGRSANRRVEFKIPPPTQR